jgi:hypothetical protein
MSVARDVFFFLRYFSQRFAIDHMLTFGPTTFGDASAKLLACHFLDSFVLSV